MPDKVQEAELRALFSGVKCLCGYPCNPTDKQLEQLARENQIKIRCCFWGCGYTTAFVYTPPNKLTTTHQIREELLALSA